MRGLVAASALLLLLEYSANTALADAVAPAEQGNTPPGAAAAAQQGTSTGELRVWSDGSGQQQFEFNEKRVWFTGIAGAVACSDRDGTFFLLKSELTQTVSGIGHHRYGRVDSLHVTATPLAPTGNGVAPYSLSLVPQSHAEFLDTVDVQWNSGYLAIQIGDDPFRNFDPGTGRFLFRSDRPGEVTPILAKGDSSEIVPPGDCLRERLVSMTQNGAIADLAHHFVVEIDYASLEGLIQSVKIDTTDEGWIGIESQAPDDEPRIVQPGTQGKQQIIDNLSPGKTNAETFDGIAVWIRLDDARGIEIPISKDRLDTTHAVLPPGFFIAPG